MNTPSPNIPQGSLNKIAPNGAASVRIWVVSIVAVHILAFGLLLMQGCKRDQRVADADATTNHLTLPPFDPGTNLYSTNATAETNLASGYGAGTNGAPRYDAYQQATNPVQPPIFNEPAPLPQTAAKEYAVQKNDTLAKIAKQHGVPLAALVKANPGLDPRKLKVNQKLAIPASESGTGSSAPPHSGATGVKAASASQTGSDAASVHVVKPGETLTKIAKQHHTTVAAIRAANGMKTNRLLANQKLKIPAGKAETTGSATGQ